MSGETPCLREQAQREILRGRLESAGWSVAAEVTLGNSPSLRADLVASHPLLDHPLVIEVKRRIVTAPEAREALAQCDSYVGRALPSGDVLRIGAVWPWQCSADTREGLEAWGMLAFIGPERKICAFVDGHCSPLRAEPEELCLYYTRQNRLWTSSSGWAANYRTMLFGRRQCGSRRL